MIIVNLHGGLGNQLFQYAFAKSMAKKNNTEFVLNTRFLPVNGYRLPYVGIDVRNICLNKDIHYYLCLLHTKYKSNMTRWINIYYQTERMMTFPKLDPRKKYFFDGYWQGFMYSEDVIEEIKNELGDYCNLFSNASCRELAIKMKSNPKSVMFHVRKGDYLSNPGARQLYENLDEEYYEKATKRLKNLLGEYSTYVFTNDKQWVIENIPSLSEGEFIEGDEFDYDTLLLMCSCSHFVIANSTLSWWATALSENSDKIVIAPRKWFRNEDINPHDLYKAEWIQL